MSRWWKVQFLVVLGIILTAPYLVRADAICDTAFTVEGESMENGKATPMQIRQVGHLKVFKTGESIDVRLDMITFFQVDPEQQMWVIPDHYSTLEGTITDVIVKKDQFSFRIKDSDDKSSAQVIGSQKRGLHLCSLEAFRTPLNTVDKKPLAVRWRSTDKTIILPYKEIK